MNDFQVQFTHIPIKSIPTEEELFRLKEDVINHTYNVGKNNIKSFTNFIGNDKKVFCPAMFNFDFYTVGPNMAYFKEIQLFALEFDSVSFDEIKKRMTMYDIPPLFAYEAFDSVDENKFVIGILSSIPYTDINKAERVLDKLLTIFPEANPSCKDLTNIYYGGKKLLYSDETIPSVDLESLKPIPKISYVDLQEETNSTNLDSPDITDTHKDNSFKFKISLDPVYHNAKPDNVEAGKISSRIGTNSKNIDYGNLKSVVTGIAKSGYTFCSATFKNGKRNKENFDQMQLLVLDVDSGISSKDILNRIDEYNLPALFVYPTFGSTDNNERFRVAFLNDVPLTDIRAANVAQKLLYGIFPEADKSCIDDVSKMYYGSQAEPIYFNPKMPTVNIEALNRSMTLYLKDRYGDTNYKRKIAQIAESTGVALNKNKLLDISIVDDVSNTELNAKNSITRIFTT